MFWRMKVMKKKCVLQQPLWTLSIQGYKKLKKQQMDSKFHTLH